MEPAPRWTLLVNPPYQQNVSSVAQTTVGPPMGLAYLAGALDHSGHPVTVLDANALGLSVEATVREAWARAPAVVGLTATTATIDLAARIALDLRHAGFEGPILVGGPHPTALPLETLRDYPAFSVAVAGEAEGRIGPLVDALEKGEGLDEIAGLVYRDPDGELHETGPASDHPEPDTLAPPARHLLPLDRYFCPDGRDAMSVIANRGCPAPCTYCLVPQHFGHRIRRRDPAAVADEIAELHATYGTRWINFIDDTFTWDADWVYAICNAFEVRDLPRRIQWQCLTRVDGVTPALLQRMRRAGCARIEMGIECASPEGIRMLRKRIDEHQVLNAFAWSRAVGLETLAFAMVIPGWQYGLVTTATKLYRFCCVNFLRLNPQISVNISCLLGWIVVAFFEVCVEVGEETEE